MNLRVSDTASSPSPRSDGQPIADFLHHADPAGWAETAVEVSNNPKCAEVAAYLRSLEG